MSALLALVGGVGFAICQYLIYAYAPTEMSMGFVQKIFYVHLSLAWWGLISFFVVFVSSVYYLCSRKPEADRWSLAACEIGVTLAVLTVLTGMFWAKKSWGVWWTWDPRLSTALIMCFIYLGWLILHGLGLTAEKRRLFCAVAGILAFLDVPLVFVSARIWRSIHPAVFVSQSGGLETEMLYTVIACIVTFGLFWLGLLLWRKAQLDMEDKLELYTRQILRDEYV